MKVYEIISEERIDEGLGVGSSIKKGVGKIANWLVPTADEMSLKNATGKGWLANISKVIPNAAIITVLTKPILAYYSAIEAAEKAVEMGNWTPAKFEAYRRQRATVLVETVGGDLLLMGVSNIGFGVICAILTRIPFIGDKLKKLAASTVGNIAAGVKKTGQAYFMESLNNKDGMVALAISIIGKDTLPGDMFIKATEYLSKKADDAIAQAKGEKPADDVTAKTDTNSTPSKTDDIEWAYAKRY